MTGVLVRYKKMKTVTGHRRESHARMRAMGGRAGPQVPGWKPLAAGLARKLHRKRQRVKERPIVPIVMRSRFFSMCQKHF